MGLPSPSTKTAPQLPLPRSSMESSGLSFVVPALSLGVLVALSYHLLLPILAPFAFAVALSVPLHAAKKHQVEINSHANKDPRGWAAVTEVLLFLLGPVYSLFESYIALYARLPVSGQTRRAQVAFEEAAQPWPLFMLKWSLRVTLIQLLWTTPSFRAAALLIAAGLVAIRFATIHLDTSRPPAVIPPAVLKEKWNGIITTRYILSLILLPLLTTAFFVNNLISATPNILYTGVSFLANPIPHHVKNPYTIIPDLGIRSLLLEHVATEGRIFAIKAIDAHLSLSFPTQNNSCVEASKMAMGGFQIYKQTLLGASAPHPTDPASAEHFRARFPQVSEVIELAAYGRRFEMLVKLGPAVAEVRWMGPDAFSLTPTLNREPFYETSVSKESLDPTPAIPSLLGPFVAALGFNSLVFFSTLAVLVSSDLGVSGHLALLTGKEISLSLLDPLAASFHMNLDLLVFRVGLVHLANLLLFPGDSLPLQSILPFAAVACTLFPLFPPLLPLGVGPAVALYIGYNNALAAAAVLYIHLIWNPEGAIVTGHMGTDGIAVVDGFALWMGWMAFGTPVGLVVGPWCFVAVRRVFRVVVGLREKRVGRLVE
ncbi:hypothetical protein HDU98_011947 [Podochytrium sp. JEL0797]|nr:hypothetical protein HDU98_011947 [Podochytrium sp. JEL0797]